MTKPGVCMVIERYWPLIGGSETQCRLLVAHLHQAQLPVMVITRRIDPDSPTQEHLDGVPVYRLPPSGIGRVWKELGFAWSVSGLLFKLRHTYTIIHLHSGTSLVGAVVIGLSKLLKKRTVVKIATAGDIAKEVIETTDRAQTRPGLVHGMINQIINFFLRRADRMLCISRQIETELRQAHFSPARLVLIPNGVDTSLFRPVDPSHRIHVRQHLALPIDKILVVFSGRLIHRKGVEVLLQAWQQSDVAQLHGHLVLVGSGTTSLDSAEQRFRHYVDQHNLTSSVQFVGEQMDIRPFFQAAEVFAFPSLREGLSNALLEAMSTGLTVLASAIGGNTDVVVNNESGILLPPGQVKDWRAALDRVLTDERIRGTLARAARQRMANHYDIRHLLPRYLELYQSLNR